MTNTTHTLRRTDRAVSLEEARRFADLSPYATLVTATPDGLPYGVPVSPVIEGDVVWFHAARGVGRKYDNLTRNPRAALVFVAEAVPDEPAFSMNYKSAILEGVVTRVEDETERLHALWLISERWAGNAPLDARRRMLAGSDAVDVWRLDVESFSGKSRDL